jgi:hypothetical protein
MDLITLIEVGAVMLFGIGTIIAWLIVRGGK